jgi:hypothetical protein
VNVTVGASVGVHAPEAPLVPRTGERRGRLDRREDGAAPLVQDVEALLRAAGSALYLAKHRGGGGVHTVS